MTMQNPFAGKVTGAQLFEKGVPFPPNAVFRVKINKVLQRNNRSGAPRFIVETTVLQSTHPDVQVGAKRTWIQKMDVDSAWTELKLFGYATLGVSWPEDKDMIKEKVDPGIEDYLFKVVQPDNKLKDRELNLETVGITLKPKPGQTVGGPFTKHNWSKG